MTHDPLADDHLETFSDPVRRPYTLPMDNKVLDMNGDFNEYNPLVRSPSITSGVSVPPDTITQIVKAKLEGKLEPTQI